MRTLFGVVSLLIALVVMGTLAKKQVTAGGLAGVTGTRDTSGAGQSHQVLTPPMQTQVKDAVDSALQQRRPELDNK